MSTTYYDEACRKVEGFEKMAEHFIKRLVIDGKSRSTHENYLRQMAKMALHCDKNPLELEPDEIDNYLYFIVNRDTDSQSSFKHLVYGLRKLYRLNECDALHLTLPGIKRPEKLPVIFSTEEIKRLLKAPTVLRDRILLGHVDIKNTEIYLHLAKVPEQMFYGLLDKLYEKPKP